MYNFIRLVRPINIVILFLTMYALRIFYTSLLFEKSTSILEKVDFMLLVISTLLIAAGGNIINDYFDVKADRINKPNKLIISKYIKQRWAILSHWFLNGISLLIGSYLSIKYRSFSIIFIYLICINILWFYSVYFKRKPLIGNILVALLTAFVPLTCGIYFHLVGLDTMPQVETHDLGNYWLKVLYGNYYFLIGMALFAFLLNFAREIVKDIQDIRGDKESNAKTLPMVIGNKNAKRLAVLSLLLLFCFSSIFYFIFKQKLILDFIFYLPLVFALVTIFFCMLFLSFSNKILVVDRLLKIAMFLGLILPYYWVILLKL